MSVRITEIHLKSSALILSVSLLLGSQIKASALDGVTLNLPAQDTRASGPIATFQPKKSSAQYDVYLAPSTDEAASHKRKRHDKADDDSTTSSAFVGGEEMHSLVPLLPCKSRGDKLYPSTQPLARALVITRHLPSSLSAHKPSSLRPSSLIASQPSPVPGAVLSSKELLDPTAIEAKKISRDQPAGLKMRINLGGMARQGGLGAFHNPPVAPVPVTKQQQSGQEDTEMLDNENDDGDDDDDDAETPSTVAVTPKRVKREAPVNEGPEAQASASSPQKKAKKSSKEDKQEKKDKKEKKMEKKRSREEKAAVKSES